MSVVIETLVLCDNCGQQNSGDDRSMSATQIRAGRKKYGWTQRGKLDYCDRCSEAMRANKPMPTHQDIL